MSGEIDQANSSAPVNEGSNSRAGQAASGQLVMLVKVVVLIIGAAIALLYFAGRIIAQRSEDRDQRERTQTGKGFDSQISANAQRMIEEGKQIFRFDTFGDEVFWTDTLKLHRALEGAKSGGVGPGVSPKTALSVGLKVDMDALPADLVAKIKNGQVNLDDPATTLALIKLNAVEI